MKKWLWVPIIVILFFLLCCQTQEKSEPVGEEPESRGGEIATIAQTVGKNLDLAVENLEKGQLGAGTGLLLDTILLVKPSDQWPEGFASNLSSAKEQFATGNLPDAVGSVSNALHLIELPDESEQSTESGEIAPLAAIMKGKIAEAKEEFTKGNADQGAIAILQALQLFAPQK